MTRPLRRLHHLVFLALALALPALFAAALRARPARVAVERLPEALRRPPASVPEESAR